MENDDWFSIAPNFDHEKDGGLLEVPSETVLSWPLAMTDKQSREEALQALHDENERLGLYRETYYDLLECVHNAVKAGDWVVDGACDPEKHLSNYKPKHEEF